MGTGAGGRRGRDRALVDQAIAANAKAMPDLLVGKQAATQLLVGQVMKLCRGKADRQLVTRLVADVTI